MKPFTEAIKDAVLLAPLTKGGNLPFRRLCAYFGAPITVSEMAYARFVARGEGRELALLRRHSEERCFGVQLAAKSIEEALRASEIAIERGADFIDINCGCPIHDTVRRGLGAHMLRKPAALGQFVAGLASKLTVPLTVKIRTGWTNDDINVREVSRILEDSGAAAITVHGRTREQRYSKSADWGLIAEIAAERKIPVIGNGDILTVYEAEARKTGTEITALMIGRGALIKPWIFRELAEGREYLPSAAERVGVYWKLAAFMKEHFRDDEKGFKRAMFFLPWHFSFFCRYRAFPREQFESAANEQPLIQTRFSDSDEVQGLEALLRCESPEVHLRIATALWGSSSPEDALARLVDLAAELGDDTLRRPYDHRLENGQFQG